MSPASTRGTEARPADLNQDLNATAATSSLAGFELSSPGPYLPARPESRSGLSVPTSPTKTPGEIVVRTDYPDIAGLRIVGVIGVGGMGIVYDAIDTLGRRVAVKMVLKEQSASALQRFFEEAEAMGRLDHPNIAAVLNYGNVGNRPYLVMKFYGGGTVHSRKAEFTADPPKMAALMAKVADALHFLHVNGHVHRDVKPQNILLNEKGEPFLADFGLVKRIGSASGEVPPTTSSINSPVVSGAKVETDNDSGRGHRDKTMTGAMLGTMMYMGPEQAKGLVNEAGPGWDVWSMGVMLYELTAGRRPFEAREPDVERMSMLIDRMRPPSDFRKDMAPGLEQLIMDCLRKLPAERLQSADDLAKRLRALYAPPTPQSRRWLWELASAAAIILAVVLAAVRPWSRTEQEVADAKWAQAAGKLRAGEEVVLVDDKGRELLPSRFLTPADWSRRYRDNDSLLLETSQPCLWAACPEVPVKRFEFSFEYRRLNAGRNPLDIGIFVAGRSVGEPERTVQALVLKLGTADEGLPSARLVINATYRFTKLRPEGLSSNDDFLQGDPLRAVQSVPIPAAGKWHTIEVRADETTFTFLLDGAVLRTVDRLPADKPLAKLQRAYVELTDAPFEPDPENGAAGVFLLGSQVEMRNIRLKPRAFE